MADEGHGVTLTFGGSGVSLDLISVQSPQGYERASIRTWHHGTTGAKTYKPGDLWEPGTVAISWLTDPQVLPPTGAAETITIVSPPGTTASVSEAFTGFIQSWDGPTMETDSEMVSTAVIKKSGASTWSNITT